MARVGSVEVGDGLLLLGALYVVHLAGGLAGWLGGLFGGAGDALGAAGRAVGGAVDGATTPSYAAPSAFAAAQGFPAEVTSLTYQPGLAQHVGALGGFLFAGGAAPWAPDVTYAAPEAPEPGSPLSAAAGFESATPTSGPGGFALPGASYVSRGFGL